MQGMNATEKYTRGRAQERGINTRTQLMQPEFEQRQHLQDAQIQNMRARIANAQGMLKLNQQRLQQQADQFNAMLPLKTYQAEHAGAGRSSAPIQAQNNYMSNVSLDNPQLGNDPTKVRDAANAYASGKLVLPDGTPLNIPSPLTKDSMATWIKYGSTSPLITQMVNANQAESETQVLSSKITEYLAPYGNTYAGMSPQQIKDSFSNDDASQDRLGKLMAGQLLTYDLSQMQIRMQQGESSQAVTKDLMDKSQQQIKMFAPHMSEKARAATLKYTQDAFQQVLAARKKVGVSASQVLPGYGDNEGYAPEKKHSASDADMIDAAEILGISPEELTTKLNGAIP